ncbi:NotI family restriction endonuclease [Sphingomonas sp. CFBP9021]|uniref:NotI family restriction endonuclease n=1 Tax=Sphingomonas sp. CFBP9021 TaxID=3096534 RepID=UPI002A6A0FB2|nr:NotI family restriction endonuclease [Sphingomonas sp. CFBP9021]MDY0967590.1 NotI family restriction endonuclease [Sphingomonas sp. CFBP9021]
MASRAIKLEKVRYGIAEWYGRLVPTLTHDEISSFAEIGSGKLSNLPCPFRQAASPGAKCNKKGGVCTLRRHSLQDDGSVELVGPAVTVCPSRFWAGNEVFRWIGETVLGSPEPTLVKEVPFLSSVVEEDSEEIGDAVGRIDSVLVDPVDDTLWCALELQAVYFSGPSMASHIEQYGATQQAPVFPDKVRRPDYRSSGPKRLMPQLQIKVPTLRRWGKKMAVLVDRPFFSSLGKVTKVPYLSNCDIVWFVVDYSPEDGSIILSEKVFTTLESSVEALTAGVPLSLEAFEEQVHSFLTGTDKRSLAKVVRLSAPTPPIDGGSHVGGIELPDE